MTEIYSSSLTCHEWSALRNLIEIKYGSHVTDSDDFATKKISSDTYEKCLRDFSDHFFTSHAEKIFANPAVEQISDEIR
jgi:hypothetical protein